MNHDTLLLHFYPIRLPIVTLLLLLNTERSLRHINFLFLKARLLPTKGRIKRFVATRRFDHF